MFIKNLLKVTAFSLLIVLLMPSHSSAMTAGAMTTAIAAPSDSSSDAKVAAQLIQRVNEIQSMDKSIPF